LACVEVLTCCREILNDEVMGTSKIDELNTRSIPAAEKREMRSLDKKIAALRHKIYQTSMFFVSRMS
jgi:hypothetical protein